MIIDKIENWVDYPFGNSWKLAFNFLKTLTANADEKRYNILDDDIFALVTSYQTRSREKAILETHRKYIDIQSVITGRESVECFSRDDQVIDVPYSEDKDAEFYKNNLNRTVLVNLYPGTFIMLLPQDAHMPSLSINNKPEIVKKVIIK